MHYYYYSLGAAGCLTDTSAAFQQTIEDGPRLLLLCPAAMAVGIQTILSFFCTAALVTPLANDVVVVVVVAEGEVVVVYAASLAVVVDCVWDVGGTMAEADGMQVRYLFWSPFGFGDYHSAATLLSVFYADVSVAVVVAAFQTL